MLKSTVLIPARGPCCQGGAGKNCARESKKVLRERGDLRGLALGLGRTRAKCAAGEAARQQEQEKRRRSKVRARPPAVCLQGRPRGAAGKGNASRRRRQRMCAPRRPSAAWNAAAAATRCASRSGSGRADHVLRPSSALFSRKPPIPPPALLGGGYPRLHSTRGRPQTKRRHPREHARSRPTLQGRGPEGTFWCQREAQQGRLARGRSLNKTTSARAVEGGGEQANLPKEEINRDSFEIHGDRFSG